MNEYDDPRDGEFSDDPAREEILERAGSKAKVPGILLAIFGAITLALAAWNVVGLGDLDRKLDEAVAENDRKIDNDPKLNDDQKKDAKAMVGQVVDVARKVVPPLVFVNLAAGGLLVIGGICLTRLSAGWLVALACVVGIIPFTTACCSGLPFGIWGLIALNSQAVRAGYRAKAMG